MNIIKYIWTACILLIPACFQAQAPVFYHLSTAEGLSDNLIYTSAIDRNGIMWIGSSEGLSCFDGNRIQHFHKYNSPAMSGNNVDDIIIDRSNNLWLQMLTPALTMLDENRNFHLFELDDTARNKNVTNLFSTRAGMVALKGNQHFICRDVGSRRFEKLEFSFRDKLPAQINFITPLSEDAVLYYGNDKLIVVDYIREKISLELPVKGLIGAALISGDEFLVYTLSGDVFYRISISQKRIIKEYKNLLDQYKRPVEGNLRQMARIDSSTFVITSRFSGLYFLDIKNESVRNYKHDPLDPRSIGGNNTFRVRFDSSGYLMVTTQTSGLHYYNVKQLQASSKTYFKDSKANVFDGYIQTIITSRDSVVWMGAQDRLIRWDRKTDKSEFIPCILPDGTNITMEETIRALLEDGSGNLWVGTTRFGILVLDKNFKTIKQLPLGNASLKSSLPSGWINAITTDGEGNKWIATFRGICRVPKNSFDIELFNDHPVLKPISRIHGLDTWIDKKKRIWIATRTGAYCYEEGKKSLKYYSVADGLAHNVIYAINEDDLGNIYFGTAGGLTVLSKDGKFETYNRSNGLRNDRCEGILRDEKGFLWIGNLNCIVRFDPVNKKFAIFEEGFGFSHAGFRMRCCYKNDNGEMLWGNDKGLTWFYPGQMNNELLPLKPSINSLHTNDSVYRFTGAPNLHFPYRTSSYSFYFSSGDLTGGKKSQVLYRLKGFDKDWNITASHGQVVYSNLPPGGYEFEIRSSQDGSRWYEAPYPVSISVGKPWWKQSWFRLLGLGFVLTALYLLYRYNKKDRQEKAARLKSRMELMELNVKMAESRFSNLRLQMNPHFLFNSLSSIQHLIVSQQTTKAYKYLTLFSNFLRSLLNFAERNFIPIDEELKILRMYIELESLRFDQSFTYEIKVDEGLTNEQVLLPTLMVQPFAENAIWHGLLHKEGEKKLSIRFTNSTEDFLTCVIEDNGIGRARSGEIQKNKISSATHSSKGIGIIRERLNLMSKKTGKPAQVVITDKVNNKNEGEGTVVTITIPYYNPEAND